MITLCAFAFTAGAFAIYREHVRSMRPAEHPPAITIAQLSVLWVGIGLSLIGLVLLAPKPFVEAVLLVALSACVGAAFGFLSAIYSMIVMVVSPEKPKAQSTSAQLCMMGYIGFIGGLLFSMLSALPLKATGVLLLEGFSGVAYGLGVACLCILVARGIRNAPVHRAEKLGICLADR